MEQDVYDLLVCMRCHDHLPLILDTLNSVEHYTDSRYTLPVLAVDHNQRLADKLRKHLGENRVYCSSRRWRWGCGLYGLLAESLEWFGYRYKFSHFMTIDYDTLFIAEGADTALLGRITDLGIGLLGEYNPTNFHWESVFSREKDKIAKLFGLIPSDYIPGEGVQGGAMLLTSSLIQAMRRRGMLQGVFRDAVDRGITIADDHLLPLLCRMCGLTIETTKPITYCHWTITCDPRGLEKKGYKLFHPTKLRPNNCDRASELAIRNYFRRIRGEEELE